MHKYRYRITEPNFEDSNSLPRHTVMNTDGWFWSSIMKTSSHNIYFTLRSQGCFLHRMEKNVCVAILYCLSDFKDVALI